MAVGRRVVAGQVQPELRGASIRIRRQFQSDIFCIGPARINQRLLIRHRLASSLSLVVCSIHFFVERDVLVELAEGDERLQRIAVHTARLSNFGALSKSLAVRQQKNRTTGFGCSPVCCSLC